MDQQSDVKAVLAGSPAKDAGLKDGDIITALDGIAVDREHPLDLLLLQHNPRDKVSLTVLRGDKTITVDLTLGTRPATEEVWISNPPFCLRIIGSTAVVQ